MKMMWRRMKIRIRRGIYKKGKLWVAGAEEDEIYWTEKDVKILKMVRGSERMMMKSFSKKRHINRGSEMEE